MSLLRNGLALVCAAWLLYLSSLAAAAPIPNDLTDDTPAAILYSGDPEQNPLVHLSTVDQTILATTTPLCPYDVHLDGQWEGSLFASDGKVYFGTSSHAPHTSALFMQYDPITGQVHKLGVLNDIVHEDANVLRPQGKLHSAITECNGYLYFSTYYGYEGGTYPGGHVIRYKLGSYEANPAAPVFKDLGIPCGGGIIYTATTADPVNHLVWVNSNGNIYNYDTTPSDSATFTAVVRGTVGGTWGNCFHHYVDSQGNLWTTSQDGGGALFEFPVSGLATTYSAAVPPCRRPDTLAVDPNWQYPWFEWGDKVDSDRFVFNMLYDSFLWILDANQARQGHMDQAFRKVANIGVGGLDTCLAGHTVYWLTSARRWNSYCQFAGPDDPGDANWRYFTSDAKAKDLHLMSLNLDDPRLVAPGYDPNVMDPNLVTDWGRVIDQNGRTPYRCEGMSSDGQRAYLTGDWRNLPTDPNNWHTLKALYLNIDGGYQQIWRGQFFAVVNVSTTNQAPLVSAGVDQTITLPVNSVALSGAVSDDGLPTGAAVTVTWNQSSGPGPVTFGNTSSPSTTATFGSAGTYILRLSASDTALLAYDEVQIIVTVAPPNQAPLVNAGVDQTITLPVDYVTLSGTVSDDGRPAGGSLTTTWSLYSGPGTVAFSNAQAVTTMASFSAAGTYILRLTATDTALWAWDDVQIVVQPAGTLNLLLHLPFDEGTGTAAADTSGNGHIATLFGGAAWTAGKTGSAIQFNKVSAKVTVPSFSLINEFSVAFWFNVPENSGTYYQYMFSWGSVMSPNNVNVWIIEANESSGLGGSLCTDVEDYHDPIYWSDSLAIRNQNIVDGRWHHYCVTVSSLARTTVYLDGVRRSGAPVGGLAIAPATAIYLGGRSDNNTRRFFGGALDDVRVYSQTLSDSDVLALYSAVVNVAPTANAGPDGKVMMPNTLTLVGSISDDGLPNPPAACTAAWSKVSGPGSVTFTNPAALATTANFSAAGTYVLRLSASDSLLSGSDDVTVTVLAAGDFNGDGKVDGLDFLIWQSNYPNFVGGATPDGGDANGDGKVDGVDFLIWQANYHG
jgi:hypothetical protein